MLGLSLIIAAALTAQSATAQNPPDRLDEVFGGIGNQDPGCAVGLSAPGQPDLLRAYGLADLDQRAPITPDTAFDIASVHKQFVAASVLLLIADGRLALTDDIRTYVPELPDYGDVITVDHLLTHTSGLRDWTPLMALADDEADVMTLIIRQKGLNFRPGDEWSYSNSGYVLLKLLVERRSGMTFAAFLKSRIFDPLAMDHSIYVSDALQVSEARALAYRRDGDGWRKDMRLGRERGGGGVVSSARDLLTWNHALAHRRLGDFVSTELERPTRLNNGRVLTYARGLHVQSVPAGRLVSHSGGQAGYSGWLGRFTGHGVSTVVLCNFEPVSATNLALQASRLALPETLTPPADDPAPAPNVDIASLAGVFISDQTGEVLTLADMSGRLALGRTPLLTVAADRFKPVRPQLFHRSEDAFEILFSSPDAFRLVSMEGKEETYRRTRPWTPSAAELAQLDGLYSSDELGAAVELAASPGGLTLRSASRADRNLQLTPVEPDLYLHAASGTVLRVLRGADQRIEGFEHHHPNLRHIRFARSGTRTRTGSSVQARPSSAPDEQRQATETGLARFVGDYPMPAGFVISVTLRDGRLQAEPTGRNALTLRAVGDGVFEAEGSNPPTRITFQPSADGRAAALTVDMNGRSMASGARR